MRALWDELRPLLRYLGLFSLVMNLLFLAPAVFILQVFDRVIPANSGETLLVLSIGTAVALLILLMLDYVRNRLQQVVGNIMEDKCDNNGIDRAPGVSGARRHQSDRDPATGGGGALDRPGRVAEELVGNVGAPTPGVSGVRAVAGGAEGGSHGRRS